MEMDKSWQPCHNQGIVFLSLAVEGLGAWHKAAITEVKKLGSSLEGECGIAEQPHGAVEGDEGIGWR